MAPVPAWTKPIGTATAVASAAAVVAAVRPNGQAFYPPCPLHAVTGIWCPICGSTRAVHALLTGDLTRALHDNVLLVAILPVLAYAWLAWFLDTTQHRRLPRPGWLRPTPVVTTVVAIVLLAFMVVRNLPGAPFTALAPLR